MAPTKLALVRFEWWLWMSLQYILAEYSFQFVAVY